VLLPIITVVVTTTTTTTTTNTTITSSTTPTTIITPNAILIDYFLHFISFNSILDYSLISAHPMTSSIHLFFLIDYHFRAFNSYQGQNQS